VQGIATRGRPKTAEHGTRSRYVAGCRCGPCRGANRTYISRARLVETVGGPIRLEMHLARVIPFVQHMTDTTFTGDGYYRHEHGDGREFCVWCATQRGARHLPQCVRAA